MKKNILFASMFVLGCAVCLFLIYLGYEKFSYNDELEGPRMYLPMNSGTQVEFSSLNNDIFLPIPLSTSQGTGKIITQETSKDIMLIGKFDNTTAQYEIISNSGLNVSLNVIYKNIIGRIYKENIKLNFIQSGNNLVYLIDQESIIANSLPLYIKNFYTIEPYIVLNITNFPQKQEYSGNNIIVKNKPYSLIISRHK